MAMDEKGLGRQLQEARRASGLTQQELCQKAGLSYSTLAKIERGAIKSPSIFTIQNIATALGIGMDVLLGHTVQAAPAKKVTKSGVRFIYFDLNGLLVYFPQPAIARLSEESGVPIDIIEAICWEYDDAVCVGDKTLEEFNAALSERLAMPVDWKEYYLDAVEPVPGAAELVAWTTENYHTGLLTNTMPGFVDAMKERALIPDVAYDAIIDSSQVRARKPESLIYEVAEAQAGFPAPEILLIDDTRANLIAAKQHGWHTIWFDYHRPEESVAAIRRALEPAE